eukprot:g55363.t1
MWPGTWQLLPSSWFAPVAAPRPCLFLYRSLDCLPATFTQGTVLTARASVSGVALLENENCDDRRAAAQCQSIAKKTERAEDVLEGRLLCWPERKFTAKLATADQLHDYNGQDGSMRASVSVQRDGGRGEQAIYYFQGESSPPAKNRAWARPGQQVEERRQRTEDRSARKVRVIPDPVRSYQPSRRNMSEAPDSIAVIGGGIAGLSFAREYQRLRPGAKVTVFDTGKRGPGGRASSRVLNAGSGKSQSQVVVDHGAQFFTAEPRPGWPDFRAEAESWVEASQAQRWEGVRLGQLTKNGQFTRFNLSLPVYIGAQGVGMGSIADHMAKGLHLEQNVWVSPSGGVTRAGGCVWKVRTGGAQGRPFRELGQFDALIIAHNGKCAEKLTRSEPSLSQLHNLLKVDFAPKPRRAGVMTLNSIYSLVFALPANAAGQALSSRLDAAFIRCGASEEHDVLSLLVSNTHKYGEQSAHHGLQVWTLLSTGGFASAHKVPQESLQGSQAEQEVTDLMLAALVDCVQVPGFTIASPAWTRLQLWASPAWTRLQLWGAAVPTNVWQGHIDVDPSDPASLSVRDLRFSPKGNQVLSVWDPQAAAGIVGDWLAAPSIQGAWSSGYALAHHLAGPDGGAARAIGLKGRFALAENSSGAADFGQAQPT